MYFKDIIGQEEIKKRLIHSAQTGVVPHAQLFTEQGGAGAFSSRSGLRTLPELHEPDGNGFMRALPVMPEV